MSRKGTLDKYMTKRAGFPEYSEVVMDDDVKREYEEV